MPAAGGAPAPLVTAASLLVVEALVLFAQGVVEIVVVSGDRLTMGVTTALFFVIYAVGLGACGWALARRRSWARAPAVMTQLILLLVAWDFVGGATTWVAVAVALVAVVVLVGIFHPSSTDALAAPED